MQKGLSSAGPVAAINTRTGAAIGGGLLSSGLVRAIGILFAGLLVVGGVVVQRASSTPPKAELRTAQVTRGAVTQTVAVSGSVNPANTWRLNFKTAGRLAEILVGVGQQVAVGQTLAKLDVSDLLIAVKQQQANVASAQAKYDQTLAGATPEDIAIAKQSVDNAKKTLDETTKSTAADVAAAKQTYDSSLKTSKNDLATAQATLTKLQNGYASAKANLSSLVGGVRSDVSALSSGIDNAKIGVAIVIADPSSSTTDGKSATTSLYMAQAALALAQTYAQSGLANTMTDYNNAYAAVLSDISAFDSLIVTGGDLTAASAQYQKDQVAYTTAAAKLSTAIDAPNAQLSVAQTSANSAQTSLNTSTTKAESSLDPARSDLVSLQNTLSVDIQFATNAKAKLTQAGTAVATTTDYIGGSYASAQQSYQSAKDKDAINQISAKQTYDSSLEKANSSIISSQNSFDAAAASYQKTAASPKSYDIASSYAGLLSAQANLDTANNNLAYATLTAPGAGVIGAINAQIGEQVAGGGTNNAFMTIANTSQLAVHGTVGEADIAKLKLGQVATVTVDAVGGSSRMTGKVTALDPVATIQQGVPVYGVDITVDVPNAQVRPGMSGTANVILASRQDVLVVPNLAVRSQGNRRFVQVLKDGQPVDADVMFGISNDTVIEVTSGLQEGDTVVLPQPRAAASGQPRQQGGGGFPAGGGGGGAQPVIIRGGGG